MHFRVVFFISECALKDYFSFLGCVDVLVSDIAFRCRMKDVGVFRIIDELSSLGFCRSSGFRNKSKMTSESLTES